jgi:2-iminobutanoate/2-iminopropanoate deaminase
VISELVLADALVEMSMIAVPNGAERVVIHPSTWMKSPNPYSYAIRTGDLLFLAGLVARNGRDNTFVEGDVAAQTKALLGNAAELLEAAGMGPQNVVSAKVYLTDLAGFQQMNSAYRSFFAASSASPSAPPARATVQAGLAGPQALVEITMVATSARREAIADGRPVNPNMSAAIRAGTRVYVSGMLGNTGDNNGDASRQTAETLARIRQALQAAGCTPADVVDAVVYLTDVKNFAAMNDAYRPFFESRFPARTTIGAPLVVPDGLVEIMVTAERGAAAGRRP